MAVEYFLDLKDIKGESTAEGFKDQIIVQSFSLGATNTGTFGHGTGGGAGKCNMQDFHFTCSLEKSSPNLLKNCFTGGHIPSGKFVARKAGGKAGQVVFMSMDFTDLMVTSVQFGGSTEIPTVQISLNFSKVKYEYTDQKADGSKGTGIPVTLDISLNKAT